MDSDTVTMDSGADLDTAIMDLDTAIMDLGMVFGKRTKNVIMYVIYNNESPWITFDPFANNQERIYQQSTTFA